MKSDGSMYVLCVTFHHIASAHNLSLVKVLHNFLKVHPPQHLNVLHLKGLFESILISFIYQVHW